MSLNSFKLADLSSSISILFATKEHVTGFWGFIALQ
jgi:hypothetical protein